MKKVLRFQITAILVFVFGMLFTSCDDDSNQVVEPTLGTLTFDNANYDLTGGYVIQTSPSIAPKEYELGFYTTGISKDIVKDGSPQELVGSALLVSVTSTKENELEPGTYNTDKGWMVTNADWSTEEGVKQNSTDVTSGTVTVSKSGDEYTVSYTLQTTNNKSITGTFKGSLAQ